MNAPVWYCGDDKYGTLKIEMTNIGFLENPLVVENQHAKLTTIEEISEPFKSIKGGNTLIDAWSLAINGYYSHRYRS